MVASPLRGVPIPRAGHGSVWSLAGYAGARTVRTRCQTWRPTDAPAAPYRTSVALVALVLLVAGCQVGAQSRLPRVPRPPGRGSRCRPRRRGSCPTATGCGVATDDGTLTRFDTRTGQVDGTPVRPVFGRHAGRRARLLWLTGQVEGERRVTAKGNYPVIKLARVDPAARRVAAVRACCCAATATTSPSPAMASRVSDPAEGLPAASPGRPGQVCAGRAAAPGRPGAGRTGRARGPAVGRQPRRRHLRRLDPATGNVEATIDLGVEPHGMAIGAGAVWIADGHTTPSCGSTLARADSWLASTPASTGMVAASDAGCGRRRGRRRPDQERATRIDLPPTERLS